MTRNLGAGGIKDRVGCWFCLDNPSADKSLIIHEREKVYLALDKGPIKDPHILLVPQEHLESTFAFDEETKKEYQEVIQSVRRFYVQEGVSFVKFERFMKQDSKVSHMMVHFVPFSHSLYQGVLGLFDLFVKSTKVGFVKLGEGQQLRDIVKEGEFFLSVDVMDLKEGQKMKAVYVFGDLMSQNLGMYFMREMICQILGMEERSSWKKCLRKGQEEQFLVQRVKNFFDKQIPQLEQQQQQQSKSLEEKKKDVSQKETESSQHQDGEIQNIKQIVESNGE